MFKRLKGAECDYNSVIVFKECKAKNHRTCCVFGEREIAKNKIIISIASKTTLALVNNKEKGLAVDPEAQLRKICKIIYIKT